MKTSVLSALAIWLVCFTACTKQEKTAIHSNGNSFAYQGTDTFLLRISKEATDLLVAPSLSNAPSWDKVIFSASLQDSFLHVTIPILGNDNIVTDYVKLYLKPGSRKVLGGESFNIDKDFKDNRNILQKLRIGSDLRVLSKSHLQLPKAYSDSIFHALQKKLLRKIRKASNARSEAYCLSLVNVVYLYYNSQPCQDAIPLIENLAITNITASLQSLASQHSGYANLIRRADGWLEITHSPDLASQIESTVAQAFAATVSGSYSCLTGDSEVQVTTSCYDDGDDGGSGPGNGGDDGDDPDEWKDNFCTDPLTEDGANAILQNADAASVFPTDPNSETDPDNPGLFLDDNELLRAVSPKWLFFHYTFLQGTYTEFSTYYDAVITRSSPTSPWKWSVLAYKNVVKTYNSLPGCLSVDVEINKSTVNFSADSTLAIETLEWTYTTSIPIIGNGVKLTSHTKESTRYIYANSYKDK